VTDIPQWAKKRACELVNVGCVMNDYQPASVAPHNPSIYAFAKFIAEHEEPPVDPLLIEAREICAVVMGAHVGDYFRTQAEAYRDGRHDDEPEIPRILAALKRAKSDA
jgi:hypothetical protein